jgi:hypothetical protein
MGGQDVPVVAELLAGDEAERGYALMAQIADTYLVYRGRTDRQIRVFRLSAAR